MSPIGILSLGATDTSSRKVPTIYDYSLSVQRLLPGQMMLDVGYVGNLQRHQPLQFNLKAVTLGTAFLPQYVVQLLEVTSDKQVAWGLRDWSTLGPASSTQLLDEPGAAEKRQLQR